MKTNHFDEGIPEVNKKFFPNVKTEDNEQSAITLQKAFGNFKVAFNNGEDIEAPLRALIVLFISIPLEYNSKETCNVAYAINDALPNCSNKQASGIVAVAMLDAMMIEPITDPIVLENYVNAVMAVVMAPEDKLLSPSDLSYVIINAVNGSAVPAQHEIKNAVRFIKALMHNCIDMCISVTEANFNEWHFISDGWDDVFNAVTNYNSHSGKSISEENITHHPV